MAQAFQQASEVSTFAQRQPMVPVEPWFHGSHDKCDQGRGEPRTYEIPYVERKTITSHSMWEYNFGQP